MAVTLTFGDVGMQQHGSKAQRGLSIELLTLVAERLRLEGVACDLIDLSVGTRGEPATLLVIRNGVNHILQDADLMLEEQGELDTNKKTLMCGRVVNKHARHNLCFGDQAIEPDYESGQGRVIAYNEVPLLGRLRTALPEYFGSQTANLQCEGNYYYDVSKCGIGFHGDGERRIVIAVRLGESIPLHYQWFHHGQPVGERIIVSPPLQHGDIYVMSEKAVSTDWRRLSIMTLRHVAGSQKFLTIAP